MSKVRAYQGDKQQGFITPRWVVNKIEKSMKIKFTLDPCTSPDNPLGMEKFYTVKEDGLKQSWQGETVFVNPPYGRGHIDKWLKKCYEEGNKKTTVVGLLPVRTSPTYFRDYVFRLNARFTSRLLPRSMYLRPAHVTFYFMPKRIKFIDPETRKPVGSPYFDNMVVIWW